LQYLGPDTPSAPLAPSFVPFLTGLLRYALLVSAGHGERLEADLVRDPGLLLTGPAWAIAVGVGLYL
jgi:decaprenyl-phosphate phosphoribosyltransferase